MRLVLDPWNENMPFPLVSGDMRDLLALKQHGATRIVTARDALELLSA